MKIIIPSKGRADMIGEKALRLFPDATLCIGHEREIAYLRRKWGRYLDVVQAKGTTRLVVRITR